MRACLQLLTVMLALLLNADAPAPSGGCEKMNSAPCCCQPSACCCHVTLPGQDTPQPIATVVPHNLVERAEAVVTVWDITLPVTASATSSPRSTHIAEVPLFRLFHAFLI